MNICFIGHRKIQENHNLVEEKLFSVLCCVIKDQINLNFFYGSKSEFNEIAYNAVKKLDNLNSKIKNIYVRAEYQYIDISYKNYLLETYDRTFYPKKVENAGKNSYIKRNFYMIDNSDICIFYYDPSHQPTKRIYNRKNTEINRTSGTKIAYNYAIKKNKQIFNIFKVQI